MKRTPLWHDPDDDEVSVSLVDASRKRKLRKDYDEKEVSGTEYAKRLQEQWGVACSGHD